MKNKLSWRGIRDIPAREFACGQKRMASIPMVENTAQNVNAISKQNGCVVFVVAHI
jgi:hypothetical protein